MGELELAPCTPQRQKLNENANSFNIELKQLTLKIKCHKYCVTSLCLLDDGRLASSSIDGRIIIYNKKTFKTEIIIREHDKAINCLLKLESNILASCSEDSTIKIFKIKQNKYETLQTLNHHSNYVNQIKELKNKKLVSSSDDNSIIFYYKDNNQYLKDFQKLTEGLCYHIEQTKENEICYSTYNLMHDYYNIYFFNFIEKEIIITSIIKVNIVNLEGIFNMVSKGLLIIGGMNTLSLIDVDVYQIIKLIEIKNSFNNSGFCMINENMFITGDSEGTLRQWEIEDNKVYLISQKEKEHKEKIYSLLKINNGIFVSSEDGKILLFS